MINKLTLSLLLITLTLCQKNPLTEGKKLVQNITYENFDVTVQNGTKIPYFLFFKMNKCGHCKMFEPTFYKLAYDMRKEPVTFGLNNIDEDSK